MPFDLATAKTELSTEIGEFITRLSAQVQSEILAKELPLVGVVSALPSLLFLSVQTQINNAILSVPDTADRDALITALNAIPGGVVMATAAADGGIDIALKAEQALALAPKTFGFDIGGDVVGFELSATAGAAFDAKLDVALRITNDNQLIIVEDPAKKEISIDLGVDFSVTNAVGNLGLFGIRASDIDPTARELSYTFTADLPDGDIDLLAGQTIVTSVTGGARLALAVETTDGGLIGALLPDLTFNLIVDFPLPGITPVIEPTVSFTEITLDVSSYFAIIKQTLGDAFGVFNRGPLGAIIDALVEPLPVIDDVAQEITFLRDALDKVGDDDVVTLLDIAVFSNPGLKDSIEPWVKALAVINVLRKIADDDFGKITFDDITLGGGPAAKMALLGSNPLQGAIDALKNSDVFKNQTPKAQNAITEFFDGLEDDTGISLDLLKDPQNLLNLLIKGPDADVNLISYSLPTLAFEARFTKFIPVLGPIGIFFNVGFGAGVNARIGLDTNGFSTGDFGEGFYLSAGTLDPGAKFYNTFVIPPTDPSYNNPRYPLNVYDPANPDFYFSAIKAELSGGVGVNAVIFSVSVNGGINFVTGSQLENADGDDKWRFSDGCIFNPITGALNAFVDLRLKFGIGPFSYTETIDLASVELANFDLNPCPPSDADVLSPPGQGLATHLAAPDNRLRLNVGAFADQRVFNDEDLGPKANGEVNESYRIALGSDLVESTVPGDDPIRVLVPGTLDVNAFGFTQRYGNDPATGGPRPITQIFADFGTGNDRLVMEEAITQAAIVSGGDGNDFLYGAAGNDSFNGDAGDDYLQGNRGNDTLIGGAGSDTLIAGEGADVMDGAQGFILNDLLEDPAIKDRVDYSGSNAAVIIKWSQSLNGFTATGGFAQGDTLYSIEDLIGSRFSDVLHASLVRNSVLTGGDGNDTLIGHFGNDFLIGGKGADVMSGGSGQDAVGYFLSPGGVHVFLDGRTGYGGDAQGDVLNSVEAVTGSAYADEIVGTAAAELLDGWIDSDMLRTGGGADTVFGGHGNDTVEARTGEASLDGGGLTSEFDKDVLSYEKATTNVVVNLLTGTANAPVFFAPVTTLAFAAADFTPDNPDDALTTVVGDSSFENLIGSRSAFGDTLTGDGKDNEIWGLQGADSLVGGAGDDTLRGDQGGDTLDGGAGLADWADYSKSPAGVFVDLADAGFGFGFFGDATGDLLTGIENLRGSDFADNLNGNSADNIFEPLKFTGGTDFVAGELGTDTLRVTYGNFSSGFRIAGGYALGSLQNGGFERVATAAAVGILATSFTSIEKLEVTGTLGNDAIFAGAGNDIISTGFGNDTVYAGTGSDIVQASFGDDSVFYGTDANRALTASAPLGVFNLDGSFGIDRLSISFGQIAGDVVLSGGDGVNQFFGRNVTLTNGATASNFEILGDVITGNGNDRLTQQGEFVNDFRTGNGEDTISPGLGLGDFVDGGSDVAGLTFVPLPQLGGGAGFYRIDDAQAFFAAKGDLLVLDYSTVSTGFVRGVVDFSGDLLSVTPLAGKPFTIRGNEGRYSVLDFDPDTGAGDITQSVDFTNIERLDVTGTARSDLLVGTSASFNGGFSTIVPGSSFSVFVQGMRGGDDILRGGGGDDIIFGQTGDDTLLGGDGNDTLVGTGDFYQSDGIFFTLDGNPTEIDRLTGGAGADLFVGGTANGAFTGRPDQNFSDQGAFYDNGGFRENSPSRAIITDFNEAEGDVLQLYGTSADYEVRFQDGAAFIQHLEFDASLNGFIRDDVIEIEGRGAFDLSAAYVRYVPTLNQVRSGAAPVLNEIKIPVEPDSPAGIASEQSARSLAVEAVPAIAPLAAGWITQENDPAALAAALGAFGGATGTFTFEGNAESFATFNGDPFGLGSGIVLSTGVATDLEGPNTNGLSQTPADVPLVLNKIGRIDPPGFGANGLDVYRIDLTGLGIDELRSLTLRDANFANAGASGLFSGFDLTSVVLSTTRLDNLTGFASLADLDDPTKLPRIDAFDYSTAGSFFTPGVQRGGFAGSELTGSVTGQLNQGVVRLDTFEYDPNVPRGFLSLGDGGALAFNLKEGIDPTQPLYLYIGEIGAPENLVANITASNEFVQPEGDLSTDLGFEGGEDDGAAMTYTFTPSAGATGFSFDLVLFSEEIPKFAGTALNDLIRVTLNGVEIGQFADGASTALNGWAASDIGPFNGDVVVNLPGSGGLSDQVRADAYTKTLTFAAPVVAGTENVLRIEVLERRDGLLDTGVLLRGGSFTTTTAGTIDIAGEENPIVEFDTGSITVSLPPGSPDPVAPVLVTLTPDGNVDLGGGPGQPVTVTFIPGGPRSIVVPVTPGDDDDGSAQIGVTVSSADPNYGGATVGPVLIEVIDRPNLAPDAVDDIGLVTPFGTPAVIQSATLLANDTDPESDPLVVASVQGAVNGTVSLNPDGSIVFTPAAGYTGPASFTYTVSDGVGGTDTAAVSLLVGPPSSISGSVYVDADNDGQRDSGEAGIAGATVLLFDANGNPVDLDLSTPGVNNAVTTDASGNYIFANLVAGSYSIVEAQTAVLAGFVDGKDTAGTANGTANAGPGSDAITAITLPAATDATGYLFGELPPNAAPVITSNGGGAAASVMIDENRRSVTIVSATDADAGQSLTYAIAGGADAALFAINPTTGALSFIAAPDYENPSDAGRDNIYDVVVTATDNGIPVASDSQALAVKVLNVAETSVIEVTFKSSEAGYDNVLGWYDVFTGKAEVLFNSLKDIDCDETVSFELPTTDVGSVRYFLIPNGSNLNTDAALSGPLQVVELPSGFYALARVGAGGAVMTDATGAPVTLKGAGAPAFFTEPSKNPGDVDHASGREGTKQTAQTLTRDTTDGPGGPMAWEDLAAQPLAGGGYSKPGDADYDDAVFFAKVIESRTVKGGDGGEQINGEQADDVFYGFGGGDTLSGGGGDDDLYGGRGADILSGGAGRDTLRGGEGADDLRGGGDKDWFIFDDLGSRDTVRDFKVAFDMIALDNAAFDALADGPLAAAQFKILGLPGGVVDSDDRIIYQWTTGVLSYDADGSGAGAAVAFANLQTRLSLSAADFLII